MSCLSLCVAIICLYSNTVYCKCIASNRWKKLQVIKRTTTMGSQKALFVHFLAHYLRNRCPNWNKSQNSVCNPTSQEVKKKIYISVLLIQGVGWWSKKPIEHKTSFLHLTAFFQKWYHSREYYFNCFLSFLAKFWAFFVV